MRAGISLVPGLNSLMVLTDPMATPSEKVLAVTLDTLTLVGVGVVAKAGGAAASAVVKGADALRKAGAVRGATTALETGAQILSREAHMWKGLGNLTHGGGISADTALEAGVKWVGEGYREVAPGVFRSGDGLRQFRMMTEDLVGAHGNIGPHVHFESLNPLGRVIENNHVPLVGR